MNLQELSRLLYFFAHFYRKKLGVVKCDTEKVLQK